MKTIVTGGAGFIGSHLVARLLGEGDQVVVIDNFHTGREENLPRAKGLSVIRGRSKDLSSVTERPDIVYHLGIYSSSPMYKENPHLVSEVVDDAVSVYEFAKKMGCGLVVASTSSIYNGLPFPWTEDIVPRVTDYYTEARYAVERLGELYWRLYGVGSTALRFFSVYGEREEGKGKYANTLTQFLWSALQKKQPVLYGNGEQSRDLTYVEDIVDGLVLASKLKKGFEIFNLGTGRETSFNSMVEMIGAKLNVRITPAYVNADISNYVMRTKADTAKARERLGFVAKVPLEVGLDRIVSYYESLSELPRL
jgi:UDP-glucose 4-epimerase